MTEQEIKEGLRLLGVDPDDLPAGITLEQAYMLTEISEKLLTAKRYFVIAFEPDPKHADQERSVAWAKGIRPMDLGNIGDWLDEIEEQNTGIAKQVQQLLNNTDNE